jgi:hypothetical protein
MGAERGACASGAVAIDRRQRLWSLHCYSPSRQFRTLPSAPFHKVGPTIPPGSIHTCCGPNLLTISCQKSEGRTWEPGEAQARLAPWRSTAGSCFGRFIGLFLSRLLGPTSSASIPVGAIVGAGQQLSRAWIRASGASDHNTLRIGEIVDMIGDRVSNMLDGPTLAPAGAAARLVKLLRSTAGNGLGRFIALSYLVGGFRTSFRSGRRLSLREGFRYCSSPPPG